MSSPAPPPRGHGAVSRRLLGFYRLTPKPSGISPSAVGSTPSPSQSHQRHRPRAGSPQAARAPLGPLSVCMILITPAEQQEPGPSSSSSRFLSLLLPDRRMDVSSRSREQPPSELRCVAAARLLPALFLAQGCWSAACASHTPRVRLSHVARCPSLRASAAQSSS